MMLRAVVWPFVLFACQDPGGAERAIELPKELREVSGIAAVAQDRLWLVQDEAGVLFELAWPGGAVVAKRVFGGKGDYEGLCCVGERPWVLRSDGELREFERTGERFAMRRELQLPTEFDDWEGLCHDADRKRLLVMPKARGDGKKARDRLPIFAADLAAATLQPPEQPWLVLSARALRDAAKQLGIPDAKKLELLPSELAVVPGKQELLLLFASDRLLLRVDFTGKALAARALDKDVLPQAEGLTFLPDGRLLVASEGDGGRARVAVVGLP
jgi:uncharacterized protein YjiK